LFDSNEKTSSGCSFERVISVLKIMLRYFDTEIIQEKKYVVEPSKKIVQYVRDSQHLENFLDVLLFLANSSRKSLGDLEIDASNITKFDNFSIKVLKKLSLNEERIVIIKKSTLNDFNVDSCFCSFPELSSFDDVVLHPEELNLYLPIGLSNEFELLPSSPSADSYTIILTSYFRYFFYPLINPILGLLKNLSKKDLFYDFNRMVIFRFLFFFF
jgi:hypothetical protein